MTAAVDNGRSDALYSYVPTAAVDDILKNGLHSGKSLLGSPAALEAAAKSRGQTADEFRKELEATLKTWKGYTVKGPNAVFHKIPGTQTLSDKHPTKTRDLTALKIDLKALQRDEPKTKLYGMELVPYEKSKGPGTRHHYIGDAAIARLQAMTPEDYWSTYNDTENAGRYAPDVPHVSIHTPTGHIPGQYLKLAAQGKHTHTDVNGVTYDVSKLWEIAKDVTADDAPFDKYVGKTVRDHVAGTSSPEYQTRVDSADLSYPIIVGPHGLADGKHRLAKAIKDGRTVMPRIVLTQAQMDRAKLALHAEDRRAQRTPELDPSAIARLQALAKGQTVGPGFYHLPLKTRSGRLLGHAAFKTVGDKHELVLATILGPQMRVKGNKLPAEFDTRVAFQKVGEALRSPVPNWSELARYL